MKHGGERESARRSCFMGRRCRAPGSQAEPARPPMPGSGSRIQAGLWPHPPGPLSAYAERGDERVDQGAEVGCGDIGVREASDPDPKGVEVAGVFGVAGVLIGVVAGAVELDAEAQLGAVEVENEAGDGVRLGMVRPSHPGPLHRRGKKEGGEVSVRAGAGSRTRGVSVPRCPSSR